MQGIKIDNWFDEFKFLVLSKQATHNKFVLYILWALRGAKMSYGKRYDTFKKKNSQFIFLDFLDYKWLITLMNNFVIYDDLKNGKYATLELNSELCCGVYTYDNTVKCADYGLVFTNFMFIFTLLIVILMFIQFLVI